MVRDPISPGMKLAPAGYNAAMPKQLRPLIFLFLILASLFASADQFTPVVASALTRDARPFPGTDGRTHLVYELVITNANATPATLKSISVVDADNPSHILATFDGQRLAVRLRNTGGGQVKDADIEYNGTRLFLVDFSLDSSAKVPQRLLHHFELMGAPTPARTPGTPVPLSYTVAPIAILHQLPVIGPPLAGKHGVALNGCCEPGGAHRSTGLAVNGRIYFAQRFAIDWMQMDDAGRLVHGDPSKVNNYTCYGADILAVADGTVVDILNNLDDQIPGKLPDPKTITIENVDGNHIVLDLGNGIYAFYAHMQKGSIKLQPGDRVKRGQVLGKLGNTGNTSGPHLHFHLMDSPSVLGSSGIPYVIDSFEMAGQVSESDFEKATGVEGDWSKGLLPAPSPRHDQFPLDLNIVNFASQK